MMHSAFFFSLLAGTAFAQYGDNSYNAPAGGSKPAPSVTAPAGYGTPVPNPIASLVPIVPIVSVITSALGAIPSGFLPDNDLPNPFKSIYIPASQLFNPAIAPAFTETAAVPLLSLLPVYSTVSSSSVVEPTGSAEYPVAPPTVQPSKPATSTTCTESKVQSTRVPLDATRSSAAPQKSTGTSSAATSTVATPKPATSTSCTKSKAQSTRVPLDATASSPLPQRPTGTGSAAAYPTGTGIRPSGNPRPTGTPRPDYFHNGSRPQGGFGWGRPRPSGKWPHAYPKPTHAAHRPTKPSAAQGYGSVKASSTPCTLETRVRPKATPAPAHY
ncbi:hypothetical protein J4E80_007198 [Alternaria sp. BMP 0032]|nr:hypothetical protein J4E80_007198 [Alternaria sp. BMP 0032]